MTGSGATDKADALGPKILSKVAWRLIPFLCLLYVFNILAGGLLVYLGWNALRDLR